MTEPWDPDDRTADRPIEYEPGEVQRLGDRSTPEGSPRVGEPDGPAMAALDERAARAARGLRVHVEQHLVASGPPTGQPAPARRRWRSRVVAVAAVAALVVGFAATQGPGADGDGRLEIEDVARPELGTGTLTPLGPRDGKDSIQLPVTVEPSTGLRDGDPVTVRGEGFVPGESVGIVQCAREAGGDTPETRGGVDGCYISDYVNVIADDQGVAQGTYRIKRVVTTPLTGTVDCAAEAGRCILAMGAISDYDRSGGLAVELDPNVEPVPIPTVQVLPTEDLADGQVVHVVADGLTPDEPMYLEVCSSDPATCWATGEALEVESPDGAYATVGLPVDGAGHLEGDVPVWRFLPGGEPGTYVDCAVSRCSLRLSGGTAPPTVPLRFRGDEPPPSPPAFGVEPSTALAPGDEVVVAGEGLPPGSELWLTLCATPLTGELADQGYGTCTSSGDGPLRVEEDGSFAARWIVPEPGSFGGGEVCESQGGCTTVGSQGPVVCDGVRDRCELTLEGDWYYGSGGTGASRPVFPPEPVTVTFRP
ncbi:MAG: neocarzinostatin apoprotein domain-containing protein [Acidimicrobiia bacterium]